MARTRSAAPQPSPPEWPADRVERRPLGTLLAYANNTRIHSAEQIAQLVASMRQWGWTMPVLVDKDGVIIAGHGRVLAAQQLGITEAPVMVAGDWTDAQVKAYRIADNRLALSSAWDHDLLRLELTELRGDGFDLSLAGFAEMEIASLIAPDLDPAGEWRGMPEFDQPDAMQFRSVLVHFKDQEAVDRFAALIEQTITEKTKSVWYPEAEIETRKGKHYTSSDEPAVSDLHTV